MAWVEASLAAPEAALLAASEAALEAEAAVEELVLEQAVRARAADRPTTARKLRRVIFFIFIHSSYICNKQQARGTGVPSPAANKRCGVQPGLFPATTCSIVCTNVNVKSCAEKQAKLKPN